MVLPEAENLMFNMNDVRVDFFCSSGPGGQSVNTKSAVLTHIPTGLAPVRKNHNIRIKTKHLAYCVLVYTNKN
jgi:peptide chain release factor 1